MPDPKKIATVILSKANEAGAKPEEMEAKPEVAMDEHSAGFHSAAEDMMLAVKSGSAQAFTEALKSFLTQMGVD